MEKPKLVTKNFKKVVPIKGQLLQKLKSEFMKDLLKKNDPEASARAVDDSINNNKRTKHDPGAENLGSPPSKVINILKVENVKMETITTPKTGVTIAISSLFSQNDGKSENRPQNEETLPITPAIDSKLSRGSQSSTTQVPPQNDAIDAIDQHIASPPLQNGTPNATPTKLLTAKMPENVFNTKVPLKMVRTIKSLKPKPILRKRFHHVESFSSGEPPNLIAKDAIDIIPDIIVKPVFSENDSNSTNSQQEPSRTSTSEVTKEVPQSNSLTRKAPESPNEKDFHGFRTTDVEETDVGLINWFTILKPGAEATTGKEPLLEIEPQAAQEAFEPVPSSSKAVHESDRFQNKIDTYPNVVPPETVEPVPSTSKVVPEREEKLEELTDDWQNDVGVVIGISRIAQIDEMLKNIPNLITQSFNAIETENVELKLIINHLLKLLKVKSVMETLSLVPPKDQDDTFDDDNDDDFPDSFNDDSNSNFFVPTAGSSKLATLEPPYSEHKSDNIASSDNQDNQKEEPLTDLNSAVEEFSTAISEMKAEDSTNVSPTTTLKHERLRTSALEDNMECSNDEDISQAGEDFRPTPVADEKPRELSASREPSPTAEIPRQPSASREPSPTAEIPRLPSASREPSPKAEDSRQPSIPREPSVEKIQKSESKTVRRRGRSRKDERDACEQSEFVPAVGKRRLIPLDSSTESESNDDFIDSLDKRKSQRLANLGSVTEKLSTTISETKKESTNNKRRERLKTSAIKDNLERLRDDDSEGSRPTSVSRGSSVEKAQGSKTVAKGRRRGAPNKDEDDSEQTKPVPTAGNNSRLSPLDFCSESKSNDFINSLDKRLSSRKEKRLADLGSVVEKLSTTISKMKGGDSTYVSPTSTPKRERLRTSAFKGNLDCSKNEDNSLADEESREPSVSRGSSVEKAQKSESKTVARGRRSRGAPKGDEYEQRVFVQEPLEDPVEDSIPYDLISHSIRMSVPRKIGRVSKQIQLENAEKDKEIARRLQEMKYFRCGSCHFDVSKHKWLEHFLSHGGLAWIDELEPPIKIEDFNEALRRSLNNFKIYGVENMKCPHCNSEKKSALSHVSHMFVCCESEEVIEARKIKCDLCNEKYLPFHSTLHKNKCSGQQVEVPSKRARESESEAGEEEEEINVSGRIKRQAVKRAQKKFKKILDSLDSPLDHLKVANGELKCLLCGETNFSSQDEALTHINQEHGSSAGHLDDVGSDSDVEMQEDESSDETEGSSGVESSEMDTDEENDDQGYNDENVSSKKAKSSSYDTAELKYSRALLNEYVEELRPLKYPKATIQWTKEFIDDNLKSEVLPILQPKYTLTLTQDAKALLSSYRFPAKSKKFGVTGPDHYDPSYEKKYKNEWRQLEIGEAVSENNSITIYCGGSVSSIDWAPTSNDDLDFLAVACNISGQGIKVGLTETTHSCVQLHKFENLSNANFKKFDNSSKLLYVIIINEGPIWSIKFHPSESAVENRVGLLAVSTANQSILIYSLPYLNSEKSIILPLQPNLICKMEDDDIFFGEHLMQASRVAWFQKADCDSLLAAGYINGTVAIWNITRHDAKNQEVFPLHVIPAHLEPVTVLDFKATSGSEVHLLTCSLDRKNKVFTFDGVRFIESANQYAPSRILCAEWWMNWPGYLIGFEDSLAVTSLSHRQPLEFGSKTCSMSPVGSSITDLSINHWLNYVVFATEAGDVFGAHPQQMLMNYAKNKWNHYRTEIISSTDFNKIANDQDEETGIVFGDFKSEIVQPKKLRRSPTENIHALQINQVCFNRNEKSYRFYALGYETGFVRIRYLKNAK